MISSSSDDKDEKANEKNDGITMTVIHCWSAPRSRSTALLYSFEARQRQCQQDKSRPICIAMDEPLYREWLIDKGESVVRPYTTNMIQGIPPPEEEENENECYRWKREVVSSLQERVENSIQLEFEKENGTNLDGGIIFMKHMAKHSYLYNFDTPLATLEYETTNIHLIHRHVLLIRDPVAVLSSWNNSSDVHDNDVTPDEVGIVPLLSIYSKLASLASEVVVLDSDELVSNPRDVLHQLCEQDLQIPYMEEMLTWESGPHECDGPWAKWWYTNVHKSAGWTMPSSKDYPTSYEGIHQTTNIDTGRESLSSASTKKYRTLDAQLMTALRASLPAYNFLHALTRSQQEQRQRIRYEDPRNANLLVWIGPPGKGGRLVPRDLACVNPWDSIVQGGDGVWEGIRIYNGKIFQLDRHLRKLFASAKALDYKNVHTKEEIVEAIFQTLAANGMRDGAHMRLTLTRGEKTTSSMNPKFNVYGTTLIILAEWKPVNGGATTYDNTNGISLISSSQRRNAPTCIDSKIHHNNLITNILPKIQANLAGVEDALILDVEGFVSETNTTNIFMVNQDGTLLTPAADYCLPGITREIILKVCHNKDDEFFSSQTEPQISLEVRRVSLMEFYTANEVFTTGTMGELTPVIQIDGRLIGTGQVGPITKRLQEIYQTLPDRPGWSTDIPPFS